MTYNQFLEICYEVSDTFTGEGRLDLDYYPNTYRYNQRNKKITDNPRLFVE